MRGSLPPRRGIRKRLRFQNSPSPKQPSDNGRSHAYDVIPSLTRRVNMSGRSAGNMLCEESVPVMCIRKTLGHLVISLPSFTPQPESLLPLDWLSSFSLYPSRLPSRGGAPLRGQGAESRRPVNLAAQPWCPFGRRAPRGNAPLQTLRRSA